MSQVESATSGANHDPQSQDVFVSSPVHFNEGPFAGFEGIIVERRESGRYLIQLHHGVYVEASLVEFASSPGATGARPG